MQQMELFKPGKIGSCTIPNRIAMSPASTKFSTPDGFVSQSTIDYYEARAKGGAGLIIIQAIEVDNPAGHTYTPPILINDDKFIPKLKELTDAVHKHGTKIAAQIHHGGPSAPRTMTGQQPLAASANNRPEMFGYIETEPPRALTLEEIGDVIEMHAQAVRRCKEAGFDICEIHAAHRYLINSFISKAWNKRTDEYNGDLKARARILLEIIARARELVGPDYPIMSRINGHEYIEQFGLHGITIEDAKELAVMLEKAGLNALDISAFPANNPRMDYGARVHLAAEIKKVVNIPIISVGGLDAEIGEKVLREKKADFIAMGRGLFADPELPNKVKEGRLEDIRPCLNCNTCNVKLFDWWNCAINPAYGKEREYTLKPAAKSKKVLVIGGGPAGMEAAATAAQRGHEVTLYEKENCLGGLMIMSSAIEDRNYALAKNMEHQVIKHGVKVVLGKEVTPEIVEELKPDVVIMATGSSAITPEIPGIEKAKVLNALSLDREGSLLGYSDPKFVKSDSLMSDTRAFVKKYGIPLVNKAVILGGELAGLEIADFLNKRGKTVTVLDPGEKVMDLECPPMPRLRKHLRQQLQLQDAIFTSVKFDEITDKGIAITTKEGEKQFIEADVIILALGVNPKNELAKKLEGKVSELYLIGDCSTPYGIMEAIQGGARVARTI
ncbi:MAG: FAD-dependent oxidoreductase [Syntrophomonadaceae bacterium]|nr:FAD-dependent oxidoreductase [Syntrophomonadaceae bacterium]